MRAKIHLELRHEQERAAARYGDGVVRLQAEMKFVAHIIKHAQVLQDLRAVPAASAEV